VALERISRCGRAALIAAVAGLACSPAAAQQDAAPAPAEAPALDAAPAVAGATPPLEAGEAAARPPDDGGPLRFMRPALQAPEAPPGDAGSIEALPAEDGAPDSIITLPGDAEPIVRPLRFGVVATDDLGEVAAALAPVEAGLAAATGREVEFLPMASYDAMIDAQAGGRIDGGFYTAAAFAAAEAACSCLDPIVAPAAADGTIAYHAIILVRRGSPVRSPAELAGRTVAAGPADSVGARLVQIAGLRAEGFDAPTRLRDIRDAGGAQAAVRLLLAGESDAAFAWSSLAGDEEAGYSRGTLAELVALDELEMDWIRVVWTSPPIGHGPFAAARALPSGMREEIEAFFLAMHEEAPQAYDALNALYGGGYRPVGGEDYAGVAAIAAPVGIDGAGGPDAPAGVAAE
jgi:phosphonate transport system substrate-binding protein